MELVCKIPTRKQKGIKLLTDSIIRHFGCGKTGLNVLLQTEYPTLFLSYIHKQQNSYGFLILLCKSIKIALILKNWNTANSRTKGKRKPIFLLFSCVVLLKLLTQVLEVEYLSETQTKALFHNFSFLYFIRNIAIITTQLVSTDYSNYIVQ